MILLSIPDRFSSPILEVELVGMKTAAKNIVPLLLTFLLFGHQADALEKAGATEEGEIPCDGNYLLAPAEPRGVLFDFPSPRWKPVIKERSQKAEEVSKERPEETMLQGYVDSSAAGKIPNLKARIPKTHEEDLKPLEGKIKTEEIHLKRRRAMSAMEKRRLLVLRGVRNHGTTGILLVSYLGGGWTIHTVLKGTAAARYGLRSGDIIDAVDGESIRGMSIERVYFRITGRRGQQKIFNIRRLGRPMRIKIPLWSVYDIRDRRSQYIEYYWYLLYHKAITLGQYHRLVRPFIYFEEPRTRIPLNELKRGR